MAITVKVKLEGIKNPPCWRRIVVPNDITFLDLLNFHAEITLSPAMPSAA